MARNGRGFVTGPVLPRGNVADSTTSRGANLSRRAPATLWEYYTQLTKVEEAFKSLKGDLGIRPIFHQLACRIEAHIFIAFINYCLHVTLRRRLRDLAPGLINSPFST